MKTLHLVRKLRLNDDSFISVIDGGAVNDKSDERFILDGRGMTSKEEALDELYTKLKLSEYKSHANYDGFDELIQPEAWPNLRKLVLNVAHSQDFLQSGDKQMIRTLMTIFAEAAKNWALAKGADSFRVELS